MLEQIEKLSSYRTIEYIYQAKLSSYQTIEYIEQNCRVIELLSDVLRCRISNVAGKVIICDNNVSASGGGVV